MSSSGGAGPSSSHGIGLAKVGMWAGISAVASAAAVGLTLAYIYYTRPDPGPEPRSPVDRGERRRPSSMRSSNSSRRSRNSRQHNSRSATFYENDESGGSRGSLAALNSNEGLHHDGSRGSHASSPILVQTLRDLPSLLRMRSAGLMGELEVGACLGRGSFGRVYKGRWKGALVAVKVCQHKREVGSKLDSLRESVLSSAIQHPNIVPAYQMCTVTIERHAEEGEGTAGGFEPDAALGTILSGEIQRHFAPAAELAQEGDMSDVMETLLISEYCDKGTLDRVVRKGGFLHDASGQPLMDPIYRCLIDVAAGMLHLHSLGVLHGDLKGANILLKSSGADARGFKCKITDFGLSRVLEADSAHVSLAENTYGTVSYMPRELLQDGKMTKQVDIYSFAIIMWELFSGEIVFRGMSATQVMFKVMTGYRPPIPDSMPAGYRQLMTACWDEDPASRPPFSDIVTWLRRLKSDAPGTGGTSGRNSLDMYNDWETDVSFDGKTRSRPSTGLPPPSVYR